MNSEIKLSSFQKLKYKDSLLTFLNTFFSELGFPPLILVTVQQRKQYSITVLN